MCKLCTLTTTLSRDRWPKPLESSVADLTNLISNAHHEVVALDKAELQKRATPSVTNQTSAKQDAITATKFAVENLANLSIDEKPPVSPSSISITRKSPRVTAGNALKASVQTIVLSLHVLEEERVKWWKSKAGMRKQWEEACEEDKLTKSNKINNAAKDMVADMQAQVGVFAKWRLGMDMGDLEP